jgi:hypothetical protein
MKVQGDDFAIQLGFHFVFDLGPGDEHATEVARDAAPLTAPESKWLRPP